jgi:RNA-binding protein 8A
MSLHSKYLENDEKPEDGTAVEVDKFGICVRGKGGDGVDRVRTGKRGGKFHMLGGAGEEPGAPAPSVDGWVLILAGIPESMSEDDVQDLFAVGFGGVKALRMPNDVNRGKAHAGYAFIELASHDDCARAIQQINGKKIHDSTLELAFAFVNPPKTTEEEEEADGNGRKRAR